MFRLSSLLLASTLLAACSSAPQKEYVAPEGAAAEQCLSECAVARTNCRAQAQDRYRLCRNEQAFRERQHAACVAQGGSFCIKPDRCDPPRTQACDGPYDACFQACGGVIRSLAPGG